MKSNIIKILAAFFAVGVIIYITTSSGTLGPDSTDENFISDTEGGSVEELSYLPEGFIVLEAENADEIEPPVKIKEGIFESSNGKCLYIGPEKVNETTEIKQYKRGYLGAAHPGYAKYSFTAPATALYHVWVRVRWSDDCGDSLDICFGDKFFATIQGNSSQYNPTWIWLKAGSFDFPVSKKLEKGKEYTLTICNREDDLYFDQILLIEAKASFEPVGIIDS